MNVNSSNTNTISSNNISNGHHPTTENNIINRNPISRSERVHNNSNNSNGNQINNNSNSNNSNGLSNRNSNLYPSYSDQPDIVRASQKDEFYKKLFEDQCFEILTRITGPRFIMNKQAESKLLSNSLYYVLTTMIGSQTLGEEYCNLRQIKDSSFSIPSIINRITLYFFNLFAPYLIKKSVPKLFQRYPKLYILKELFPNLERLHLAFFYFDGSYYDFSKRLSNIRYIFNRKVDQKRPKYHILGVLIIIQLIVQLIFYLRDKYTHLKQTQAAEEVDLENQSNNSNSPQQEQSSIGTNIVPTSQHDNGKCTLCLENRKHTTSTECGHLFCWSCLTEWCNNKPECPLCRRPISIRSLVPIYNYS